MKKLLILLAIFVIVITQNKNCSPIEKYNKNTHKCDCKYGRDFNTRKCRGSNVPKCRLLCPQGKKLVYPCNCISINDKRCRYGKDENGKCKSVPRCKLGEIYSKKTGKCCKRGSSDC